MARLSSQPRPVKRRSQARWRRRWRYYCLRLIRLRSSADAIARGLAVGTFAGMFPLMGFQIIIGVLLAIGVRGNKLAAAAATWISNPFTYLPLFAFNFQVGQWLLSTDQLRFEQLDNIRNVNHLLHLGGGFLCTLFTGCFVMGVLTSTLSYFGGRWLVRKLRQRYRRQGRSSSAKVGG